MKKYAILTYIFNDYENVKEPLEISDNCEYVLITDDRNIKSDVWKIKYLPSDIEKLDGFTKTYYVKYHPFEFVSTDVVFVFDSSIQIKKSLDYIYYKFIESNCDICLSIHWAENTPFNEFKYWIRSRNYSYIQAVKNKLFLEKIGLKEDYKSYFEAGFKICKRNNVDSNLLNEFTYESLLKIGVDGNCDRLDQTIFAGYINVMFNNLKIYPVTHQIIQSDYLQFCKHKSNIPIYVKINYNNLWLFNKKIKVNIF